MAPPDMPLSQFDASPKAAALRAAAAEPIPSAPFIVLESDGVVLIYGCDEQAIQAGKSLEAYLDVTVLMTPSPSMIAPGTNDFPVVRGVIQSAKGHFGAFDLIVDEFAEPLSDTGGLLSFGSPRHGARSRCALILDMSGRSSLFSPPDLRDGYLRADPRNPAAVIDAVSRARDLSGTFEKTRYISFTEGSCAHSRSRITGCTRCLDVCPAGAIAPSGNHVAIDPTICAGCGQCSAVCPTGAAAYNLPPLDVQLRKIRTLLASYVQAGGEHPILLVHDEPHGDPLIQALMELEPNTFDQVLPLSVNEVTQVGLESIVAAFAFGASAIRFLLRARPRHDVSALYQTIELTTSIVTGLGFLGDRVSIIESDDPEVLGNALRRISVLPATQRPSTFLPMAGDKRGVRRQLLRQLHLAAPAPVEVVSLPRRAPFGSVELDVSGCTLCLACVSACPTGALSDNPDRPMLSFTEVSCIQCGLCAATCPEQVITLKPQLDFRTGAASPRALKSEQPFCCIRCGKPFGVKSTIERVTAKLAESHWMFKDSRDRLDLIKMCDDCRVVHLSQQDFDPHAPPRPAVRTTDDYLRERDAANEAPSKDGD